MLGWKHKCVGKCGWSNFGHLKAVWSYNKQMNLFYWLQWTQATKAEDTFSCLWWTQKDFVYVVCPPI